MLRKLLDFQLSLTEKGKPLHKIRPLITAGDTFMYEAPVNTSRGPHIRDAIDLKRWMLMVVIALLPCILMAIWNTGIQKFVFASGDFQLMDEFRMSSTSIGNYFAFAMKENRWLQILQYGAMAFIPIMIISYAVGGLCEGIFACVRGHEIAEGFLVTGMLYPLILPPTIPYWMVAVGVAAGVIIGKELFGGTGMNILNPALTCRTFLFFTFPGKMSGDVWVGTNPTTVRESLTKMNTTSGVPFLDGYTQPTPLAILNNIPDEVKRVHIDAIATNTIGTDVNTIGVIQQHFERWSATQNTSLELGSLTQSQMQDFVTSGVESGGLGLASENYQAAYEFTSLNFGLGSFSDGNLFLGNRLGSMGETSILAIILGAAFLIWSRIASWRVMFGVVIGALFTGFIFQSIANFTGSNDGAWNVAKYALPAYKHLLMGGLAFGLVFMATDPVSSPSLPLGRWIYGIMIGILVVGIRLVNPAYPEGTMLAILLGNVFSPLIDHYVVHKYFMHKFFKKRRLKRVKTFQ